MNPLAPFFSVHHYGGMDQLEAFRRAVDESPGSLRALARAASVNHSTLSRMRSGEVPLSANVVEAVARALEGWSADCADLARRLREAGEE